MNEKYISGESKNPCIFLPYLGEFGIMIFEHIKFVHFYKCPHKTVMCSKEDRIFFPSADEFVDFATISNRDISYNFSNHPRYKQISGMVSELYPNKEIIFFRDIPNEIAVNLIFEFNLPKNIERKFDIVIGSRKKELFGFKDYQQWNYIVEKLQSMNYKIAVVGSQKFSSKIKNTFPSWEFGNDSKNACLVLKMSRLYLGTSAGISHLACFLQIPSILINPPKTDDWNIFGDAMMKELCETNKNFTKRISAWNNPQRVNEGFFL